MSTVCTSLTPLPPPAALSSGKFISDPIGNDFCLFFMSGLTPPSHGGKIAGGIGVIPSFQSTISSNKAKCDISWALAQLQTCLTHTYPWKKHVGVGGGETIKKEDHEEREIAHLSTFPPFTFPKGKCSWEECGVPCDGA